MQLYAKKKCQESKFIYQIEYLRLRKPGSLAQWLSAKCGDERIERVEPFFRPPRMEQSGFLFCVLGSILGRSFFFFSLFFCSLVRFLLPFILIFYFSPTLLPRRVMTR